MQFDNQDFESKVSKTLGSLKALNQSLDATESVKGFEHLGEVTRGFNFDPLIGSVQTVHDKFSAFEVMAITALQNITNSAINTGKQLVSSLTIDQVNAGWDKFDAKTKSVGTLVSQGNRLEEVTDAMNRLATFTDETSYDMVSMTESIAKFTATGKGLDDSLTAMEGIALWAAASGQNAQKASNAMYQLSQALGAGVMRKEDYKSIQNLSMDTDEFRQKALEAAVALGTLRDNGDGTYESLMADTDRFTKSQFAEHLTKDAWFTADVMMEVYTEYAAGWDKIAEVADEKGMTVSQAIRHIEKNMSDFDISEWELKIVKAGQEARSWGDAVDSVKDAVSSGWTKTFELIFGDYEEATSLWTDLANSMYDVFAEPGNNRNELLQGSLMSGWKQLVDEGIKNSDAYKDAIIDVAKEHGVAIDSMIEEDGSFEESLKRGWATSDIFSEALQNLTDKTAGLSAEQLEEMGLTEKQAESFAKVNEKIKEGEIDLDDYIEKMGRMSGRENLLQAFWDTWEAIADILGTVKRAFQDVFPPATADTIYAITERIRDMAANFKAAVESLLGLDKAFDDTSEDFDILSEATSNFKSTFRGLFAAIDIVAQAISAVFGGLKQLLGPMGQVGGAILGVTGNFGDWLYQLDQTIKTEGVFTTAVQNIVTFLQGIPEKINGVFQKITGITLGDALDKLRETLRDFFSGLKKDSNEADATGEKIKKAFTPLETIFEGLKKLFSGLGQAFKALVPVFGALGSAIGEALGKLGDGLADAFANSDFEKVFDIVNGGILASLGVTLKGLLDNLKGMTGAKNATGGITSILNPLKDTLEAYQDSLKADTLIKIAGAIAILVASVVVLSSLDVDTMGAAVAALGALFVELVGSMAILNNSLGSNKGKGMVKLGAAMDMVAGAVLILAAAMKKIAELNPDQVMQGLVSIGVLLGELAAFLKLADLDGVGVTKGIGLILLAESLKVMAGAVAKLGEIDQGQLVQGLIALGVVLAELAGFLKLVDLDGLGMTKGVGLLLVAASLKVMVGAVAKIGAIDTSSLIKGLIGLAAVLAEIGVFVTLMNNGVGAGGMIGVGAGLLVISAAITVLAGALKLLSTISLEQMAIAVGGLGVALLELGIAVTAMQGTLAGAAALVVVAGAVAILAPALKLLATMSLADIGTSLLALAGAFTVIGVAGALLTPLAPALLAFGGAIALVGVGMLACAAAAELFAIALGTLAVSGGAGITVLITALAGLIGLIPEFIKAIADGVVNALAGLAESIPALIEGFAAIITALCGAVIECVPQIMEAVGVLLDAALELLGEYVPKFVLGAVDIIVQILNGIAEKEADIIDAAINLIISFIEGLAKGIEDNTDRAIKAIEDLGKAILKAFLAFFGIHSPSTVMADQGNNLVQGLINGVDSMVEKAKAAIRDLGQKMLDKFKSFKSDFSSAAKDIMSGLINGVKDKISSAVSAAKEIGSSMLSGLKSKLGIASPSKEMAKLGAYSDEGFAKGLLDNTRLIATAANKVGDTATDNLTTAFSNVGTEFDGMMFADPVIRPVLDMSDVSSGMGQLSAMLDAQRTVDLAWQASGTFGGLQTNQNGFLVDAVDRLDRQMSAVEATVARLQRFADNGMGTAVGNAVARALDGVAVEASGRQIGQLVTAYQGGMQRRGGR